MHRMSFRVEIPPAVDDAAQADEFASQERVDAGLPDGYEEIRANADIQFNPVDMKELEPREPSWIERVLQDFFGWLGELLEPVALWIASTWWVLQWLLLGLLVAFVAYALWKLIGPLAEKRSGAGGELPAAEPEWQPDREESLALLEDADRLAAEGKYEEAVRMLLQRSIGQIAAARPDWVDPSSTARELAALPALSEGARKAFSIISHAVERSLWALRNLNRDDWEMARSAYAEFALARIEGGMVDTDRLKAVPA